MELVEREALESRQTGVYYYINSVTKPKRNRSVNWNTITNNVVMPHHVQTFGNQLVTHLPCV